jgi:protein phosphatase
MIAKTKNAIRAIPRVAVRAEIVGETHTGHVREDNQDFFHIDQNRQFAIVADGMGGHEGGQVASRLATQAVASVIDRALAEAQSIDDEVLVEAFIAARDAIEEGSRADEELAQMGTTLVLGAMAKDGDFVVAHMGDSRLYRLRNGKITCLTRDHNVLGELLSAGILTPEQSQENARLGHLLTRALSPGCVPVPDVSRFRCLPGDHFVLCSDGLHGVVSDPEILDAMQREDNDKDACRALIEATLDRGAPDNVTAVILAVHLADNPSTH